MNDVDVKIYRVNPCAKLPEYATAGSVGLDLQTMQDILLHPGNVCRVPTGIAIALPPGYEAQIRPRSSVSGKGLLVNIGTVDADYRGEIMLNVAYIATTGWFKAAEGDRIAQLIIAPVPRVHFEEVSDIEHLGLTVRGCRGFGSTGA